MNVADQLVATLEQAGVKHIYAITGDSLNGVNDAVRRNGKMQWIHVRHEETGAFAAAAEATITGTAQTVIPDDKVHAAKAADHGTDSQITPQYVMQVIDRLTDDDAIFTVDTGITLVWASQFLNAYPRMGAIRFWPRY